MVTVGYEFYIGTILIIIFFYRNKAYINEIFKITKWMTYKNYLHTKQGFELIIVQKTNDVGIFE